MNPYRAGRFHKIMKGMTTMKVFFVLFLVLMSLGSWMNVANAQEVQIPDPHLAAVVLEALGLPLGTPIITKQGDATVNGIGCL